MTGSTNTPHQPPSPLPRPNWATVGTALLLALAPMQSEAASGVHFDPVATFEASSSALSVRLSGNTAYLADADIGVHILDVSNPAEPTLLATYDSPGFATELLLAGNRAYLADGDQGLQILDVSQPADPKVIGTYNPGVFCLDVKVVGNRAYLACADFGLHIVDISDPANPVKLGEYLPMSDDWFVWANKLQVVGTTVYLCTSFLCVIDVSDPANPVELSRWDDSFVTDCAIRDNRAYLAAADDGVIVFDVANPAKPVRLTRVPAPGGAYAIHLDGNRIFTHGGVVDISNPVAPVLLGSYPRPGFGDQGLALAGDLLFQPNGANEMNILRFRQGETQSLDWAYPADRRIPVGQSEPVGANSTSGLPVTAEIIAGPAVLEGGQVRITGTGLVELRLVQPGNATFLPATTTRSINRSEARISTLGTFALQTNLYGARVVGTRAYLGNDRDGLRILDVSDLTKPTLLSTVTTTNQTFEAELVGQHAFVADGLAGLKVVDVLDPRNPVTVTNVPAGTAISVRIRDNLALVTDFAGRKLFIIDIAQPTAPRVLSETPLPGDGRATAVAGNKVLVASGWGGVLVLDVTDPAAPVKLSTFLGGDYVRGLAVKDNIAYVPSYYGTAIKAFDLSDPTRPTEIGRVATPGYPRRIEIVGNLGFLVAESGGLQVVDLQDPTRMIHLGTIDTGGYARDIQAVGQTLHVADQWAGFRTYRLDQVGFPVELAILAPDSTPFGSPVALAATADNAQPVHFAVIAGPGRIVGNELHPTGIGTIEVAAATDPTSAHLPARRTFHVHATLPDLELLQSGNATTAVWPAGLANVQLLHAPSLTPDITWTTHSGPFAEAGGLARSEVDTTQPMGFLRLAHPFPGTPEPLALSGWNRDVVLENQPNPSAQAIGMFSGTWFEAGLDGFDQGLPSNREIVHQDNPWIRYRLQPYTTNNALVLTDDEPRNRLVLDTPTACSRLFILSAGSHASGTVGSLSIHFTDGSSTDLTEWLSPAWYARDLIDRPIPTVFAGVGRSTRETRFTVSFGAQGFSMFQTEIDLASGPHAGKAIASVEFTKSFEPGTVNAVYAISGVRTPTQP